MARNGRFKEGKYHGPFQRRIAQELRDRWCCLALLLADVPRCCRPERCAFRWAGRLTSRPPPKERRPEGRDRKERNEPGFSQESPQRDDLRRVRRDRGPVRRSEEHTSELQSLMRHSYAGFC